MVKAAPRVRVARAGERVARHTREGCGREGSRRDDRERQYLVPRRGARGVLGRGTWHGSCGHEPARVSGAEAFKTPSRSCVIHGDTVTGARSRCQLASCTP